MFPKIAPFFDLSEDTDDESWPDQQRINVERMLEIIRVLVSPDNPMVSEVLRKHAR